ncbi:MAG: RsmE family RNA methyltransferase [bacterium]
MPRRDSTPASPRRPRRCFLTPDFATAGLHPGDRVRLNDRQYHHLITVLRHGAGDVIEWFDGQGALGLARLAGSDRGGFAAHIETREQRPIEPLDHFTLLLGLPKLANVEACLESATHAGVGTLRLTASDHSPWRLTAERTSGLLQKWELSVLDATEQCGRLTIPRIVAHSLAVHLTELPPEAAFRVALGPHEGVTTGDSLPPDPAQPGQPRVLAIGPEGGWSPREVALLTSHRAAAWNLPGTILTTVSATGILPALWRWGGM